METYQKISTICILILTIFASALVLYSTKTIMIPFVFSIFMYLIISPCMHWLAKRFKLHHSLALVITIALFIMTFIGITALTSSSVDSFLQGAGQYKSKVQAAATSIEVKAEQLGFDIKEYNIKEKLQNLPIFDFLKQLTGSMLSIFSNTILIIIFTLFLLTGESVSSREVKIIEEIKASIAKYVSSKLLLSLLTGVLSYIVFLIAGSILQLCLQF